MKIILCGPYLTEKMELLLPEASPAAGKFLRNLKIGLQNEGLNVTVLSYQSIGIPEENANLLINEVDASKDHEEFYVFKCGKIIQAIVKYRQLIYSHIEAGDFILFYNSIYPTVLMQSKIHRMGAQVGVILADFTEPREYKSLARKIIAYVCKYDMKRYDKYVLLSCGFMNSLGTKENRIHVQGGIDDSILGSFSAPARKMECVFYYSGLLSEENGVKNMVEAFKKLKSNNVRLIISGKGPLENYVSKEIKNDARIEYVGYVDNAQYYKLLEKADILINPRNMELPQNRNNFPSKIMEYLASGRLIISTRFPSWEELQDNIIFCESDEKSILAAMYEACKKEFDERNDYYKLNTKTSYKYSWKSQAKKIADLCVGITGVESNM